MYTVIRFPLLDKENLVHVIFCLVLQERGKRWYLCFCARLLLGWYVHFIPIKFLHGFIFSYAAEASSVFAPLSSMNCTLGSPVQPFLLSTYTDFSSDETPSISVSQWIVPSSSCHTSSFFFFFRGRRSNRDAHLSLRLASSTFRKQTCARS